MSKVHWSFWAIAAVGLLYNIAGVANFVSQLNADVVAGMPEGYRAMIENRPVWATAGFAVAVFGSALACVLLLLRQSVAQRVLIAALLGAVVTLVNATALASTALIAGNLVQLVVTAGLIWYVISARKKGWLA